MFKSIGTVIVLLVMFKLFTAAFVAAERAVVATFAAVEVAAEAAATELAERN